jgi:hypothetical protein
MVIFFPYPEGITRAGRIKEAKYYSQPNLSDLAIPVSRRDKGGMGGHEG